MESIGQFLNPDRYLKKKEKNIHSEEHELADTISKFFQEPKRFSMWLGLIKKYGVPKVYSEWKRLSDYQQPYTGKLLVWKLKQSNESTKPKDNNAVREVPRQSD